jgi:hypothetical protein
MGVSTLLAVGVYGTAIIPCGHHLEVQGVEKRRGGPRETWYRPGGRYGRERATPTDERVGNRERKHRPEATRRSVWIEAEAKFQLRRCQESERGVLLMNEA